MFRKFLLTALSLMSVCVSINTVSAETLIFHDDFNGTTAQLHQDWSTEYPNRYNRTVTYNNNCDGGAATSYDFGGANSGHLPVTDSVGKAVLSTSEYAGGTSSCINWGGYLQDPLPYKGSVLSTWDNTAGAFKVDIQPPFKATARLRIPYAKHIWPAFWFLDPQITFTQNGQSFADRFEIDVFEMFGYEVTNPVDMTPRTIVHNVHNWWGDHFRWWDHSNFLPTLDAAGLKKHRFFTNLDHPGAKQPRGVWTARDYTVEVRYADYLTQAEIDAARDTTGSGVGLPATISMYVDGVKTYETTVARLPAYKLAMLINMNLRTSILDAPASEQAAAMRTMDLYDVKVWDLKDEHPQ